MEARWELRAMFLGFLRAVAEFDSRVTTTTSGKYI